MTQKTVNVTAVLIDYSLPQGDPKSKLTINIDVPLSATIMHDNMLNVQREVEQAIYTLFKKYHDDTTGSCPQSC